MLSMFPQLGSSAAEITNTPAGNIAATDVQSALNELDTDKAEITSGTYTATGTGFTANPTTTATYKIIGGMCFINILQNAITGTSNSVALTITGMPVACRPSSLRYAQILLCTNNGATISNAYMAIGTNGVMTLGVNGDPNGWTAASTKALLTTTISYLL